MITLSSLEPLALSSLFLVAVLGKLGKLGKIEMNCISCHIHVGHNYATVGWI